MWQIYMRGQRKIKKEAKREARIARIAEGVQLTESEVIREHAGSDTSLSRPLKIWQQDIIASRKTDPEIQRAIATDPSITYEAVRDAMWEGFSELGLHRGKER